jgi:hypothetical protein
VASNALLLGLLNAQFAGVKMTELTVIVDAQVSLRRFRNVEIEEE